MMKVSELVERLCKFSPDTEVIITDGYRANCYSGNYEVVLFEDLDGSSFVDIGIGGLDED